MSRADDRLREAHGLAEQARRLQAGHAGQRDREPDSLAAVEGRLTGLGADIRAALLDPG